MAGIPSGPRTVGTYEPGKDAAERYPDWVIRHRDLRGIPEVMCLERKVILIDAAQGWPAKRSGLAHAVAHLDCGHVVIGGHLGSRQEVEAESLAARRLITVPDLADAIRWCGQRWPSVARHLAVDERILATRLDKLHPSERAQLSRELESYAIGATA
ncbi:hypothetical protein ACQCX2_07605 [Propionibacteriaceae bacterium Y1700]|uniref:hypothetical protein n=1 Tax=Microlunatus sp. Y1700 TaxID=3418487 RepID=UPI003DA79E1A